MTIKQIVRTKGDQLINNLPEELKSSGKEVVVSIEDTSESQKRKIELMKKAATDSQFLQDIDQVSLDFESSDLD